MIKWQEGPPPSFEDWADMREFYLSLHRPRKTNARTNDETGTQEAAPRLKVLVGQLIAGAGHPAVSLEAM